MRRSILSLVFGIFVLYALPIYAQTYVSSTVWIVPDGNTADLSKTYTEGITLQVTWNPVPEGYQFQTLSNLWVTTWDYDTTQFSQLLTENVNTNNSGTYDWTITIPTSVLSRDAKYVLRFKDLNPVYNSSSQEISSTGFLVINGASSSTSTASPTPIRSTQTSSSASSTAIASTSTTQSVISTISATPTSISTSEGSGLSGGAKAGIAVGVVAIAFSITRLSFLFFRRQRHAKRPSTEPSTEPPTYYDPPKQPFIGNRSNVIAEIGGGERVELQGS
ncbi:hypothetical protein BPAE_0137g00020 [Botrytis paeoniae]|uniref:Ser-Thr-rich glycosyl-phosphatidyl-inositol-anchored membrane family-domain-containing protein n=1 Tax=Botrytis paeoniae TaxID=278948 RepID=A0A4Z1FKF8_9HELO|nr:hypothetical protein BPAE_0137g00020 [Botrytis paeoniae]